MQPSFLTISASDINRLDDVQLKELLFRLGRAELLEHGLGVSGLWAGGHQNSPDGGADVRVSWRAEPSGLDFAPRRRSEFQSKATTMPAGKVVAEMRPKGAIRPMLVELAALGGAYVIASTESCAEGPLEDRIKAMRSAVADVPNADALVLDFYDAARLATFVSRSAGLVLWVQETLGTSSLGWRSWGAWSAEGRDGNLEFISDDKPRGLIRPSKDLVSIAECVRHLRLQLSQPRRIARIVGLSGLGKTRLAEVLFDPFFGEGALNSDFAIYGDIAASPSVPATEAADRIVRSGDRAIIIADNCPPETHHRLAEIVRRPSSHARLLTIDFDLEESRSDQTLIVELSATSDDLIDRLLQNRAPLVGQVDRKTIVEFSGGNARIALALASTAADGDGLANLSEPELLDRLFLNKRRQNDLALARCAEAAALVYSLNVEEESSEPTELSAIAAWAGVNEGELYRQIAEMLERGLVQKRGRWRAVLPHALAAKLARRALQRLPERFLLTEFHCEKRLRLFMSFCKRLGMLHDLPEAVALADKLLSDEEGLGAPALLAGHSLDAFVCLAPASPNTALLSLKRSLSSPEGEQVLSREHPNHWKFARIIRQIAYETPFFEQALDLLVLLARREKPDENRNATQHEIEELFHLQLSGTLAPPRLRLTCLDKMLRSADLRTRQIGLVALEAMLEANHFSSSAEFSFGARNRTYGWQPQSFGDISEWFGGVVERVVRLTETGDPLEKGARTSLAGSLGALCRSGLLDIVDDASRRIRSRTFWAEGWRAVCEILSRERASMPDEVATRLHELERVLRPTTVEDRFQAYVTSEVWFESDPVGGDENNQSFERPGKIAKEIGREIGCDLELVRHFVPRAVSHGRAQAWAFGIGLFESADSPSESWEILRDELLRVPAQQRNDGVVSGFICAAAQANNPNLGGWLDSVAENPELGPHIVQFSAAAGIDSPAIQRLRRAIASKVAPLWTFRRLSMGRAVEATDPDELACLLRDLLASRSDGAAAAVDILAMRFFGERQQTSGKRHPELLVLAREILQALPNTESGDSMRGPHLANLTTACFANKGDPELARGICRRILLLLENRSAYHQEWEDILKVVMREHPSIALDTLLDRSQSKENHRLESWLTGYNSDDDDRRNAPIDIVACSTLISWVLVAPDRRAPLAAEVVGFTKSENGILSWSDVAWELLGLPVQGLVVAKIFLGRLSLLGWVNASRLLSRRPMFEALRNCKNPDVQEVVPDFLSTIDEWINRAQNRDRLSDESFE